MPKKNDTIKTPNKTLSVNLLQEQYAAAFQQMEELAAKFKQQNGDELLQKEYAAALERVKEIKGSIYQGAVYMAKSAWKTHEDQQYFPSKQKRRIHEENWRELPFAVMRSLKAYDPSRGTYANYLMNTIKNIPRKSYSHINAKKRQGEQNERSFIDGGEIGAKDAAECSPEDRNAIDLIKQKLRHLHDKKRSYKIAMESFLLYYTGYHAEARAGLGIDISLEEVGKKYGKIDGASPVSRQCIEQRVKMITPEVTKALQPIYDAYIEPDSVRISRNDHAPIGDCLQRAVMELAEEYGIKAKEKDADISFNLPVAMARA